MKVKTRFDKRPISIEEALRECMDGNRGGEYLGAVETLEAELYETKAVLLRFMVSHIQSVDDLNAIAGWSKYAVAEDPDV